MEMIKDLLKQIRKNPNRPDLHNTLGAAYRQEGNLTEAANHFLTAARMFASADSSTRNVNKAMAILKRLIREFPKMQDPYFILAELYEELDNREEAVKVYNNLSDLYVSQQKYLMAVSVFDKVISMVPDDLSAWKRFAQLNREAGMPFHASQGYARAALIAGDEDRQEKLGLTTESLHLDPENGEALELLRTLLSMGDWDQEEVAPVLDLCDGLIKSGQAESALKILDFWPEDKRTDPVGELRDKAAALVVEDDDREYEEKPLRSGKLAGTKVLVVDDEKEICLLLEQILRSEGFHVLSAGDGEEALKLFVKEKPPLVVSDAMLPKLHGFELCSRIKEISDHRVKVMILTAVYKKYKYKGKVQEEYHVDEYLDKPFQITEFLDTFYRMAESMADEIVIREEEADTRVAGTLIMVGGAGEKDLALRLEKFCDRAGCSFLMCETSREVFDTLQVKIPDIILITDKLPGMDPFLASYLLRNMLDLKACTIVLVTRDPSLLEGSKGQFNHRVAAPVTQATLDTIVKLHQDNRLRLGASLKDPAKTLSERRIEAVIRSKVERVLKSHNHLEEYYNSRIRELEKEIEQLKRGPGRDE